MKLEHYSPELLKKEILAIIGRHLNLSEYKVFVFGSRVSGKADARSDIDVGIAGPKAIPATVMTQLREEIEELPTLYKIDVVDFTQVSDRFRAIAQERIEVIS